MWEFISRRTASAVIVLSVLSVFCFILIRIAPGDPVEIYLGRTFDSGNNSTISSTEYNRIAQLLGTDLPPFYFGLSPTLRWNGTRCHYHHWMLGLIKGGTISYRDSRSVWQHIGEALPITLFLSLSSLLLTFVFSVLLATYMVLRHQKWQEKLLSLLLFSFSTLPSFWVAALITTWVANQFSAFIGLPAMSADVSQSIYIFTNLPLLILPILCLTYGSTAYVTQQLRTAMLTEMLQEYIKTARAKGVSDIAIVRHHSLRNALTPIIGMIGRIIPGLMSGAILIELVFNIQGMGQLTYNSIHQRDWPIVMAVVLLTAFFSIVGNILADMFQRYSDPRTN